MKLYAMRIFVRDWDASCSFNADVLGLPERFRNDELGWAGYDLGGPCFGLQQPVPGLSCVADFVCFADHRRALPVISRHGLRRR
jgi:hypothetical protein